MKREEFDSVEPGDVIFAETAPNLKKLGYHDVSCYVIAKTPHFVITTKNSELDGSKDQFSILSYEKLKDREASILHWQVSKSASPSALTPSPKST
jgi:hypothetical protein